MKTIAKKCFYNDNDECNLFHDFLVRSFGKKYMSTSQKNMFLTEPSMIFLVIVSLFSFG